MQSDSSGWVDGWGTERETFALLWETTFLSSSQYEAARASRLQGLQSLNIHAGGILPCVGGEGLQRQERVCEVLITVTVVLVCSVSHSAG